MNSNRNKEKFSSEKDRPALVEPRGRALACLLTLQSCVWNSNFKGQEGYVQPLAVLGPARVSHVVVLHHEREAAPGEIRSDAVTVHDHTSMRTGDKSGQDGGNYTCATPQLEQSRWLPCSPDLCLHNWENISTLTAHFL